MGTIEAESKHILGLTSGMREQIKPSTVEVYLDWIVIHGPAGKRAQLLEDVLMAASLKGRADVDFSEIDVGPFYTTARLATFGLRNTYKAYKTVIDGRIAIARDLRNSILRVRSVF